MKKVSVRKLMLVIGVFAIICCISTINYASDVNDLIQNITELPNNNTPAENTNINTANTPANLTPLTTTPTPTNNTTGNTILPKTGVNDTIMWVLIGVSAIAAIYTYKKVRDYNV